MLGIKPKKSLGQNFLINEGVYRKIVTALDIKTGDKILEVGPGLGTLTQYLADTGAEIVAVEKDDVLAGYLLQKFNTKKNVKIVGDDILKFNPETCSLKPVTYKVVGNIPYYLTSHLLRTVFEKWPRPELIVLMIQKEVAQRIVAKPPHMSLLAVSIQYYAQPKIISYVSHGNFYPPPEVDSALIRLMPRLQVTGYRLRGEGGNKKPETWTLKPDAFFRVVRTGFAGKRKQLGNNLARGLKLEKNFVEEKLQSIGIDSKRRAETITLGEWGKLANTLPPPD